MKVTGQPATYIQLVGWILAVVLVAVGLLVNGGSVGFLAVPLATVGFLLFFALIWVKVVTRILHRHK